MSIMLLIGTLASPASAASVGANFAVEGELAADSPISFNDRSSGDVAWVYWNFGDGESAREPNTAHTYAAPGRYQVRYTVCASRADCDTKIQTVSVVQAAGSEGETAGPTARFTVSGSLVAGQPVTFTDRSIGELAWVYWSFGDGSNARAMDATTHTFATAGTYQVRYSVCEAKDRCDLETKSVEVAAAGTTGGGSGGSGTPMADFSYSAASDRPPGNFAGTAIEFTGQSSGDVAWVYWSFGDGSSARAVSTTHTYAIPGKYSVRYSVCAAVNRCDGTSRVIEVGSPTEDSSGAKPSSILSGLDMRRDNARVWSPDGTKLAVGGQAGSDSLIQIWDIADLTAPAHVLRGHTRFISDLAWAPDSRRLASVGFARSTRIWDLNNPTQPVTIKDDQSIAVAWSPDGTTLVTTGEEFSTRARGAQVWDVEQLESPRTYLPHASGGSVADAKWSPDGTSLLTRDYSGAVRVWDPENLSDPVAEMRDRSTIMYDAAWSPDASKVATTGSDHIVRVWDVAAPSNAIELRGHTGRVRSIEWSPDGTMVATASRDGEVRIWNPSDPTNPVVLDDHVDSVGSASWSPDGSLLASASSDGTVRLWDLTDLANSVVLTGHNGAVDAAYWSPDGKRLASFSAEDDTARIWTVDR